MNLEPNIQYINVENIIPNRFQPRLTFDEEALKELAMSIKEHGIIQPLVLRKLPNDKFEIIAGERRYKASQIAGLEQVPAIIANLDDNKSAEVALVENLQRRNLSAIEEAKSYKKLLDRGYLTQDELARRLGISQSSVANKVRLLNLTEEVQDALMEERISERHARSLLQIHDKNEQINMLNKIIANRLTVRQLDTEIKQMNSKEDIKDQSLFSNLDIQKEYLNQLETLNFDPVQPNKVEEATTIEKFMSENSIKKSIADNYETFSIPTAVESTIEQKEPVKETKPRIVPGELNTVINAINEIEKEATESGFDIETESYDFEDLYQIIIKIEK